MANDNEASNSTVSIDPLNEPPNGRYPARVDDKGRLKLPVGFQKFIEGLREKKLFCTSLDGRIGQIYPIANWRENKKFFNEFRENPKAASRTSFIAQDLGADSEMDAQGRVLLPPEMRRQLGIENQSVHLYAYKGRIQILSETVYAELKASAMATAEDDQEKLERAGLQ